MSQRVTVKDVRAAFGNLVTTATELGVRKPDEKWILQEGSMTYGRAYRIYLQEQGSGGLMATSLALSDGFLGMTASEAQQAIWMLRRGMQAVAEAHQGFFKREL